MNQVKIIILNQKKNEKGNEEEKIERKFILLDSDTKNDKGEIKESLNINKEGFFPKSYLNNLNNEKNSINKSNINRDYPLADLKDNNDVNNNPKEKENILRLQLDSSNYSKGWFYNDNEKVYYYNNQNENNTNNNGNSENNNSDDFYYTLNPFPDSNQNNYHRKFYDSHKHK